MLTEQQKLQVVELWNEGYSYGYIADTVGSTRSAVAGHCHRHEMVRSKTPNVCRMPRLEDRNKKPRPIDPDKPTRAGVSILRVEEHHCRVVIGHGKDGFARFCGQQKSWPTSFCAEHRAQLTYKRPAPGGRVPRYMQS